MGERRKEEEGVKVVGKSINGPKQEVVNYIM